MFNTKVINFVILGIYLCVYEAYKDIANTTKNGIKNIQPVSLYFKKKVNKQYKKGSIAKINDKIIVQ